jgi:hypothetical protein
MIYIDPTIEEHVPKIAALFQIGKYEIGYDEHYTTVDDEDWEELEYE